ncbi:MAG TPA: GGDEF domain-containing protein [Cellvibrio sp.]
MTRQVLPRFRHTVQLLVWAVVAVPLLILCIYQLRADYERQVTTNERELVYETERFSFLLTQGLLQLMGDLDRIASDGNVIRSLSMPLFTPISVQKIESYLGSNPSAESVMLIDKEFFPIEVIPTWALTDDIAAYEPYMAQVVSSPTSISDPRPRMFIPPTAPGQPQMLVFIRPILTASTSLAQPFQVDGLLLVNINTEKLMQSVIDTHQGQPDLLRLLSDKQAIFSRGESNPALFRHQAPIMLGLGNQALQVEFGHTRQGVITQVLMAYRTQAIAVILCIVLMVVLVKKLADKVVQPLQLLDEQRAALQRLVQYSMEVHQADVLDELGQWSIAVAQTVARQPFGLYLLRNEFFGGCELISDLEESQQQLLHEHHSALNSHATLFSLIEPQGDLHVFAIGGTGADYQGFLMTARTERSQQAEEALMVLCTMLSSALRQHCLNARLHQLAHLDSVTGLPNRHLFNTRYNDKLAAFSAGDAATHFGVFVVDVNGLKFVNDHYGHQYGDQMLIAVARALKQAARANDTVARVGGDEFYLLLEQATEAVCAQFVARLTAQCRDLHMLVAGERIAISFSVGFASTDKDSLKNLLILADERMYSAKKQHYRQLAAQPPGD